MSRLTNEELLELEIKTKREKESLQKAPAGKPFPPRVYIRNAELEHALSFCDLGDSVGARLYVFPHVDMLPELVEVISKEECDALIQKQRMEAAREAFDAAVNEVSNWMILTQKAHDQGGFSDPKDQERARGRR